MKKILMVCLGNICRSPLAEGILQSKLDTNFFSVDSAGTAAYHIGELPDQRSIAVAKKHGIDISNQKARKFDIKDFIEFDIIYAMDKENYQNICSLAKNNTELQKVKMILDEVKPSQNLSVPDPYYGGDDGFQNVYQLLDEACEKISKNYK
ncbi:MAG: protein-tyrosine-phosphatase [Gammaproteobacteria bacterium]|nr:protein-tyrosine-phosphatase [Gammaproteobacteria bacterium]MDG1508321.1 low molecular weight phosphotyrosine protein phosphatase [Flavobacteriaceae bacterium]MDG2275713.1 low molecular weight phosphotyrosine protein phosphatase [Flavobacteriaceae bacterium]|tara:strand:+ start:152 stop:604 length:453 start_codon:yes stop_codon:yes gene_type:complete